MLIACFAAGAAAQEAKGPPVAALVNGEPIYVAEILNALVKFGKIRNVKSPVKADEFADTLNQIIERRLVVQKMTREGGYFTEDEVENALKKFRSQVAENVSIEQELARQGLTMETLRTELIWDIAWNRYLDRNLTDQLQNYFNAHRKNFDGTQVQASHILLRPETAGQTIPQLTQLAEKIREAIESGKISFEKAAERFSVAPSRAQGGDIGSFPRRGVMNEAFAKAAFDLEPGQVSEPVASPFGVHLIRVTDIKPGSKQWTEVLDELRPPASLELFEKLAHEELSGANPICSQRASPRPGDRTTGSAGSAGQIALRRTAIRPRHPLLGRLIRQQSANLQRIARVARRTHGHDFRRHLGLAKLQQTPDQSLGRFEERLIGWAPIGQRTGRCSALQSRDSQPIGKAKMAPGQHRVAFLQCNLAQDAVRLQAFAAALQQPAAFVACHVQFAGVHHGAHFLKILGTLLGAAGRHELPGVLVRQLAGAQHRRVAAGAILRGGVSLFAAPRRRRFRAAMGPFRCQGSTPRHGDRMCADVR